jgi:Putative restriction endonuclease
MGLARPYVLGELASTLSYWLCHYRRFTPCVESLGRVSIFLDPTTEIETTAALWLTPGADPDVRPRWRRCEGVPELLVEVTASVRNKVFRRRLRVYEQSDVREFLVVTGNPRDTALYSRENGRFERVSPACDGSYGSRVFPGLWLDPAALFSDDWNEMLACLDRGMATEAYTAFVMRSVEVG